MPSKLLFVVEKDDFKIAPSETFLKAHLAGMRCETISLIGHKGKRCINNGPHFLPPATPFSRAKRWLARKTRISTMTEQDTASLKKFMRAESIDLVFAEYGPTAVAMMEASATLNIPLIAHFHGWDAYTDYNLNTYGEQYKQLFQQSAAIIAVSQHMRNQLISLGAPPIKVFHNACGAEINQNYCATPSNAAKRFIMVGRLTAKKAPMISLEAFSRLLKDYPEATLDVIGDGELRIDCELFCKKKGIHHSVFFHGAQSHQNVVNALSKAGCFIQHSVKAENGDHEGTPVGILEAMGMGLPVVSTRHAGIIDIIQDNKTGVLVEEFDVNAMYHAMKTFATQPEKARMIGEQARKQVLENWTSDKSIDRLWNIIETASVIRG